MKSTKTVNDYIKSYRELVSPSSDLRKIKLAILSSSTIHGLREILTVKSRQHGLYLNVFMGGYNQYAQDILNDKGKLYEFQPDIVVLFVDTRSLMGDLYFDFYQYTIDERKTSLNSKIQFMQNLINIMKTKLSAKIVVHNFEVPLISPLGIIDNKQELGVMEFVENINVGLRNTYKSDQQVFILDYNSFTSEIGKRSVFNDRMYYLADMKIDLPYLPALADQYMAYIKPLMFAPKKCMVLDLDNTLWGGVLGEDGIEGVKLGPTIEGRPFLEFQKYILSMFHRGVILAINSKNNLDDVLRMFEKHPHMMLKEKHFASKQINWNDKISNMKAISDELNVGMDSLVFIDDDKLNREMIKSALPGVKVVDLPEDPALYLKTLIAMDDFNSYIYSEEDKKKGQMYYEQRKRQDLKYEKVNLTEYLKALDITVKIRQVDSFSLPRISQLTQKTNQFNMTTRRYYEEDIKRLLSSDNSLIYSIKVEDKYGDNGIAGSMIVDKSDLEWRIDTFLLSCRVIGRRVEEAMLAHLLEEARKYNVETLIGEYIPTERNLPAKDFYKESGFEFVERNRNAELWRYPVEKEYKSPEFIKVIK